MNMPRQHQLGKTMPLPRRNGINEGASSLQTLFDEREIKPSKSKNKEKLRIELQPAQSTEKLTNPVPTCLYHADKLPDSLRSQCASTTPHHVSNHHLATYNIPPKNHEVMIYTNSYTRVF